MENGTSAANTTADSQVQVAPEPEDNAIPATAAGEGEGNATEGAEETYTKNQVETIVRNRVAGLKAKIAEYEKAAEAAPKPQEPENGTEGAEGGEDASKSAELTPMEKLAKVTAELEQLKLEKELDAHRREVSAKTGYDPAVLAGNSIEEIDAFAETLKAHVPIYPSSDAGNVGKTTNPAVMTDAEIEAIKDPDARLQARMARIEAREGM